MYAISYLLAKGLYKYFGVIFAINLVNFNLLPWEWNIEQKIGGKRKMLYVISMSIKARKFQTLTLNKIHWYHHKQKPSFTTYVIIHRLQGIHLALRVSQTRCHNNTWKPIWTMFSCAWYHYWSWRVNCSLWLCSSTREVNMHPQWKWSGG